MSDILRVWLHPAGQPTILNYEDGVSFTQRIAHFQPGQNPKFVALAASMGDMARQDDGPSDDHWQAWLDEISQAATALSSPVWWLELPEAWSGTLREQLLQQASRLGLSVLDQTNQQVLHPLLKSELEPLETEEVKEEIKEEVVEEEIAEEVATEVVTFSSVPSVQEVFVYLNTVLDQCLLPLGFERQASDDEALADGGPAEQSATNWSRLTPVGLQQVQASVRSLWGQSRCDVRCILQSNAIVQVLEQALPGRDEKTIPHVSMSFMDFHADDPSYDRDCLIRSGDDLRRLKALIQTPMLKVLIQAESPEGFDAVLNDDGLFPIPTEGLVDSVDTPVTAQEPANLAARCRATQSFAPVVSAWLMANVRFEELVDLTRAVSASFEMGPKAMARVELELVTRHLKQFVARESEPLATSP